MKYLTKEEIQDYLAGCKPPDENGCIEPYDPESPYPLLNGYRAYLLIYGPKRVRSNEVRHICGNYYCVTQEHLDEGSHHHNMNDRLRHLWPLFAELVNNGVTNPGTIAYKLGVSRTTVNNWIAGRSGPRADRRQRPLIEE